MIAEADIKDKIPADPVGKKESPFFGLSFFGIYKRDVLM